MPHSEHVFYFWVEQLRYTLVFSYLSSLIIMHGIIITNKLTTYPFYT